MEKKSTYRSSRTWFFPLCIFFPWTKKPPKSPIGTTVCSSQQIELCSTSHIAFIISLKTNYWNKCLMYKKFSVVPPVWNSLALSHSHIFHQWTSGCEDLNVLLMQLPNASFIPSRFSSCVQSVQFAAIGCKYWYLWFNSKSKSTP